MAVARRTTGGTATLSGNSNAPGANKPANTADGDILICSIAQNGGAKPSTIPSGWVEEFSDVAGTNPRLSVYSKYVSNAASEPASYSWGLASAIQWSCQITAYTGHNITVGGASVFDAVLSANSGAATATACPAPSITTTQANCMLVGGASGNSSTTQWTGPAGQTEVYDPGTQKSHCFYSDEIVASAGATGTRTYTQSAARAYVAWQGAIAPAGAGSTTVNVPLGAETETGFVPSPSGVPASPLGSMADTGLLPIAAFAVPLGLMAESGFVPSVAGQPSVPLGALSIVGQTPTAARTVPLGTLTEGGLLGVAQATPTAPLGLETLTGLVGQPQAATTAPIGSETFTGLVPSTFAQQQIIVPLGSLALTGFIPNPLAVTAAPIGVLTETGLTPTAARPIPLGAAIFTGLVPNPTSQTVSPIGAIAETGLVPAPKGAPAPPIGLLTLTGLIPTASRPIPLGSLTLAGFVPNPIYGGAVPLGAETFIGLIPTFGSPLTSVSVPLGLLTITGFLPSPKAQPLGPLGSLTLAAFIPVTGRLIPLGAIGLNGLIPPAKAQPSIPLGATAFSPFGPDAMANAASALGLWAELGFIPTIQIGGAFGIFASGVPYLRPLFESEEPFILAGFMGVSELIEAFDSDASVLIGEET